MINLLQENKEIQSQRTNSTFGFLPTHKKANLKKPKELFSPFAQRIRLALRLTDSDSLNCSNPIKDFLRNHYAFII